LVSPAIGGEHIRAAEVDALDLFRNGYRVPRCVELWVSLRDKVENTNENETGCDSSVGRWFLMVAESEAMAENEFAPQIKAADD